MLGNVVQFGPYRSVKVIGRGGFGDVYLAESDSRELVVLKQVAALNGADKQNRERSFNAELQALKWIQQHDVRSDIVHMIDYVRLLICDAIDKARNLPFCVFVGNSQFLTFFD